MVVVGWDTLTNIRYFIRLGAYSTPSLTAALRQASVAERRARAPACAFARSGVKLMHQYRIYTFRDDGHFSCVQRIECADEREAVQKARQFVNRQDGELWESDRLIARFPDPQKATE